MEKSWKIIVEKEWSPWICYEMFDTGAVKLVLLR